MKIFYLVNRTEASAIGLRDRITRLVITDEPGPSDEVVEAVEAETWKEAKSQLVQELTPQQKDLLEHAK